MTDDLNRLSDGTAVRDDISSLPWSGADSPATVNVTTRRKCRRHHWSFESAYLNCDSCGALRNPAVSRRSRKAATGISRT